ncbi:MAG: hypothetical protein AAFQ80_17545 [Cyanobacteria bacterium J06621_8]
MGYISYPRTSGGALDDRERKLIEDAAKRKYGKNHLASVENNTKISVEQALQIIKGLVGYPGTSAGTTVYYDPARNISIVVSASGSIVGIYSGRINAKWNVAQLLEEKQRSHQKEAAASTQNKELSNFEQEIFNWQRQKREEKLTECRNFYSGKITRLHSKKTLTEDPSSSYEYWQQKSTEEIIQSLEESKDKLLVKKNGKIIDGNTRFLILEERDHDLENIIFSPYKENE